MSTTSNIEYLKKIPPFNELSEESLSSISDHMQIVSYPADSTIFETGEEGDSLYIIQEGSVRIYVKEPKTNEKIVLSILSQDDYFGEMALITGEPRSASIETLDDVILLRLDKLGFEKLLHENPSISISLSHMLSQRLKNANIQRLESEKLYHSKISPSGSISEVPFYDVLKFCEQNSLTGKLKLDNDTIHAEISFLKGNVQDVVMADLKDDEAIDSLMKWKEGTFVIEPTLFSMQEDISSKKDDAQAGEKVKNPIELLIDRALTKLVSVVGSSTLKNRIEETIKQVEPYFPSLKSCTLRVIPEVESVLSLEGDGSDKQTLAIAVFLQSLLINCRSSVFGMSFLDIRELSGNEKDQLEKMSFFQYMDHANEFVV